MMRVFLYFVSDIGILFFQVQFNRYDSQVRIMLLNCNIYSRIRVVKKQTFEAKIIFLKFAFKLVKVSFFTAN
jgi:hypothetical protein